MDTMLAFHLSQRVTDRHVNSARPHAQVRAGSGSARAAEAASRRHQRPTVSARLRAGLAATLRAAARTVAPPEHA